MGESRLDRHILELAGKSHPRVCFLPQAGGESAEYVVKFYAAFNRLGARPSHLSLFRLPTADLASFLLEQDVLYVSGGNTRSMVALWREWGLDVILRRAWEEGVLLTGLSAGAICWFEQGITDSVPGELNPLDCLGLLTGSCCPHYDSELERRPTYHRLLREGEIRPGFGVDDGAALHFVEERLERVVSVVEGATAYQLEIVDGMVQERALRSERL